MSIYSKIAEAYDFYVVTNFGDISQKDFARIFPRAAAYISALTLGRSETVTDPELREKVMLATFAVCEEMQTNGLNDGSGAVLSESNDGISVTYAASKDTRTVEQKQYEAAYPFLFGTGLLYRGVCFRC